MYELYLYNLYEIYLNKVVCFYFKDNHSSLVVFNYINYGGHSTLKIKWIIESKLKGLWKTIYCHVSVLYNFDLPLLGTKQCKNKENMNAKNILNKKINILMKLNN